jgi:hypothetical protein
MSLEMEKVLKIYVRMIEGIKCKVPVDAKEIAPGKLQLLDCDEFDPEDSSLLLEFLPGDIVREKEGIATELINSPETEQRIYWRLLFEVVDQEAPSDTTSSSPHFDQVVLRIRGEIESGERWHYPAVREWINQFNH